MFRVGVGYDSHRTVDGRPLILGGERIPSSVGLKGHSDGDALCHAITDAVLGAASAGDIGRHFPDTDPQYAGANSLELLKRAVAIVREKGYAEVPRIAPHVDRIRGTLAGALGVTVDAVSVKGKTNEGMGEAGRGEGMFVHAVALLRRE
jgi:2-C-methyl-D-erythritol 2,4-cyclodiphosphate synthase